MFHTSYIKLMSANDPDALGPSIADTYNLDIPRCMELLNDYSMPHHLVLWATPKSLKPRYVFAYTIINRILHNKRHLHQVTVTAPIYTFPFWELSLDHLLVVKQRLFEEMSYEFALICLGVLKEVFLQAKDQDAISAENYTNFSAICDDRPVNRRNSFDELCATTRTSLAQCLSYKRDSSCRRDALAIACSFLGGLSITELARLSVVHVGASLEGYYLEVPQSGYSKRILALSPFSQTLLMKWLERNEGPALFCPKFDTGTCVWASTKAISKLMATRFSLIARNPLNYLTFQEYRNTRIIQAYLDGNVNRHVKNLLQGTTTLHVNNKLRREEMSQLFDFQNNFEKDLGSWDLNYIEK
jgi:hypothetical protein